MAGAFLSVLSACTSIQQEPAHIVYGKVIFMETRQIMEKQPNLTGAAVGGITGGFVGYQFGKGNGKTAMTVLGAVAGTAAGRQYNQKETIKQMVDLAVQMRNGKVITITIQGAGFQLGQEVRIVQQGRQATIEAINN